MGNTPVSGLIAVTVYTRGFAPRHWVCGIIEDGRQLKLISPLGPNSEADVLCSQLAIAPHAMYSGWEGVRLQGVFDGSHRFQADLNTRRSVGRGVDSGYASIGNTWNATLPGRDGQLHVLSIEFKPGQLVLPFDSTAASGLVGVDQ